jgi:uncharacterized protein (DUF1778 family)
MENNKQLSFPVTKKEHAEIKTAASSRGMTIKSFVLGCIIDALNKEKK